MVNAVSIRDKINSKIFTALGSTATLYSKSSQTLDDWGDETASYSSSASITVVPWYHIYNQETFEAFGDLEKGEVDLAVRYDQTLDIDDKLTWNGKVYKVKVIEYYTLKDTLLVKAVRLKETLV